MEVTQSATTNKEEGTLGEPLQPSAESTKISMDETFTYQKPTPKAAPAPEDQKKLLQAVVEKSLQLSQNKQKDKEAARETKKAEVDTKTEVAPPQHTQAEKAPEAKQDHENFLKAQDLL